MAAGRACRILPCAVGLALAFAVVSPASAQPELEEPDPTRIQFVVTELEAVLGPGTVPEGEDAPADLRMRVLVENAGNTPARDLELVVVVHPPVETRSELRQALDRNQPQGFVTTTRESVRGGEVLAPGDVTGLEMVVPATDGGWSGTNAIQPVHIAVVRGIEVLDEVTTAVIHLDQAPGDGQGDDERGTVAGIVVWPLATLPWRGPEGHYPAGVDEAITPGGRLDVLVSALEAAPTAPVLLAPDAHLLEDLRDRADGFIESHPDGPVAVGADAPGAVRARDLLGRIEALAERLPYAPVSGAYGDAAVVALNNAAEPLPQLAATAVAEGRARLRRLLGREFDAAAYLTHGPLDAAALDLLAAEHLLVPWNAVDGPDLSADPTLPTAVRSLRTQSGRRLTASVSDPYVTGTFTRESAAYGHPVAIQRLLAETAMIHLEYPALIRPLLVLPSSEWFPDPQVARLLVPALLEASWFTLASPTEQAGETSRPPAALVFAEPPTGLDPAFARALTQAWTELSALDQALPDDIETIGGRNREELEDQLLRSTSRRYLPNRHEHAQALVSDVQAALDEAFGSVTVPASAQVTLTSERGAIPVTLQRDAGGPLRARVTVSSRGNLRWPQRTQVVELRGPGTQTVSFDTLALGRGTFAVTVRVTDVTGTRLLDEATLSVRSTAISRPALIATTAVVLLLLLWGAVRRRRPRRPTLEVVREPESEVENAEK